MTRMVSPAELILPELRVKFPKVMVVSDVTDVDHRAFPLIIITDTGGERHPKGPRSLSLPNVSMSTNVKTDWADARSLYYDALDALYDMRDDQKVTAKGWIHSVTELMGCTRANPLFEDTWRALGTIRIGLRPNHQTI